MPDLRAIQNLGALFPDLPESMFEELREEYFENIEQFDGINTRSGIINKYEEIYDLKQVEQSENKHIANEIITEVLRKEGISEDKLNAPPKMANNFQKILHNSGASVENASRVIANVMINGKFDNSKLKAAELVLDLHGIREMDGKVKRTPSFQFIIKDSNVNLAGIFAPTRDRVSLEND